MRLSEPTLQLGRLVRRRRRLAPEPLKVSLAGRSDLSRASRGELLAFPSHIQLPRAQNELLPETCHRGLELAQPRR